MPVTAKNSRLPEVGELLQVVGWMSEEEKIQLKSDLEKHPHISGQSDFINCAAQALRKATEAGAELAQPMEFLTVEQRDRLTQMRLNESAPRYGGRKKAAGQK